MSATELAAYTLLAVLLQHGATDCCSHMLLTEHTGQAPFSGHGYLE